MLFKPEDMYYNSYDPIQEAADILNESVYLNENECVLSPRAIPVVENSRIGACVVAFDDVERLAEDHGVDYITSMIAIAEANDIYMDELAVSVPEWRIIAEPRVVNELSNVIVAPMSPDNPINQFCNLCVDLAIQEDNEGFIDDILMGVITEALITGGVSKKAGSSGDDLDANEYVSTGTYSGDMKRVQSGMISKLEKKVNDANAALKRAKKSGNKAQQMTAEADLKKATSLLTKYRDMGGGVDKRFKGAERAEKAAADAHAANTGKEAQDFYRKQHEKELEAQKEKNKEDMLAIRYGEKKDEETPAASTPAVDTQTKSLLDRVKDAAKWPVKKISQAIESLKTRYQAMKAKIQSTPPEKRSIFQKFMNLIMSAIDKLSNLLSSKQKEGATA